MESALHEIPLAVFTTLAPMGSGAFIALFIAFMSNQFDEAKLKLLDKLTVIPLLVAFAGLLASFAHLTQPLNAINVANTIGATPMANEITAFGVFMAAAAVYWIWALTGKMSYSMRKGFTGVLTDLAVLFALAVGAAYLLPTIPAWNSALTPVSILGFCLFGGSLLGLLVLQLAGCADNALSGVGENRLFAMLVVGFLAALVGVVGLWVIGSTATSPVVDVAANASSLLVPFVVFIILSVIVFALGFFSVKLMPTAPVLIAALVLLAVAVFLARLTFYGMQIGIAL